MTQKEYNALVKEKTPPSPFYKDIFLAFLVGGLICVVGQAILNGYTAIMADKENAAAMTSVTLIFLSALFTGLGLYDTIAKHAGAGTIVPITGFANAVVSPAMEFKSEGFVLGLGAKMFVIAGPVIVYGTLTSVVCGVIYYLVNCL